MMWENACGGAKSNLDKLTEQHSFRKDRNGRGGTNGKERGKRVEKEKDPTAGSLWLCIGLHCFLKKT